MSFTPTELIGLLKVENVVISHTLASSTFIFWDQVLTLQDEIELIWCAKHSLVSLLFFVIRYLTFVIRVLEFVFYTNVSRLLRPSVKGCKTWIWFEAISGHVLIMAVEILLMMRIFAFYGRTKSFLAFLFFIFIIEHAASLSILAVTLPGFDVWPSDLPPNLHSSVCVVVKITTMFTNYWIPCLCFQIILFLLLITKFVYTKWTTGISTPRLLIVFVRDGAWAFALIFAALIWSAAGFEVAPQQGDTALTWIYSILGFTGSRLILNLRSTARERALSIADNITQPNILSPLVTPYNHAVNSLLQSRSPVIQETSRSRLDIAVIDGPKCIHSMTNL